MLSRRGSTNFVHPAWAGFDMRGGLEATLGLPVTYLNDGNAAALWGHVSIFGSENEATSVLGFFLRLHDVGAAEVDLRVFLLLAMAAAAAADAEPITPAALLAAQPKPAFGF